MYFGMFVKPDRGACDSISSICVFSSQMLENINKRAGFDVLLSHPSTCSFTPTDDPVLSKPNTTTTTEGGGGGATRGPPPLLSPLQGARLKPLNSWNFRILLHVFPPSERAGGRASRPPRPQLEVDESSMVRKSNDV